MIQTQSGQTAKCEPTKVPDDIDIPALREKYRQERDRRVRTEGNDQYFAVMGDYADFYETDPYATPAARKAISEDVDVVVLGGGFAGLLAATRLKQQGVTDVRIIEMGGDFGGTWYWNRYPGIQCDVEAYSYLPLLEDLNYIPKVKYSFGPEIFEHCRRIGTHFVGTRQSSAGGLSRNRATISGHARSSWRQDHSTDPSCRAFQASTILRANSSIPRAGILDTQAAIPRGDFRNSPTNAWR
jgi:hypothetical protein